MSTTQLNNGLHADDIVTCFYAKRAIAIANQYNENNRNTSNRKVVELQPLTLENLMKMTVDEKLLINVDLPQDTTGEVVEAKEIYFNDGQYYLDIGRTHLITTVSKKDGDNYYVKLYPDKKDNFGWMLLFGTDSSLKPFDFLDCGEFTTSFIMKMHYDAHERPEQLISQISKDKQTSYTLNLIKENRIKFNKR